MSQCIVPNWNLRHQRQEQVEGEEGNRSPHVQSEQNLSYVVPMSNYEVTELTWENGQLGLHGLGGLLPPPPAPPQTKQTWVKPGDTLESIVHQATFNSFPQHGRGEVKYSTTSMPTTSGGKWGEISSAHMHMEQNHEGNLSSMAASSGGKWRENSSHMHMERNPEGSLSSMAAASSGGKWRENSSHMHMEQNPEGSFSSMAAASSGGKWRENSSHMQVEQQNGGEKVGSMAIPSGGKWREKSAHMQVEQNGGVTVKVNSIPTSSGGKWRENLGHLEMDEEIKRVKLSSMAASSGGKWGENKRVRSESKQQFQVEERATERSACASASATFCRDTDTTMMTWASFESPRSLKSARNTDDDSAYHDCSENQDGEGMTKGESFRSQSSARRSRAAAVHNQSERRRRDRINEKMKALQKLVPNASKTDKASMLDEVIEYLKQLQAQVHMMSNARNMPQMVMPLGMQQQLQMSLLARMGMGMGMGMGMLDVNNLARNLPHSFPPLIHAAAPLGGTAPSFVAPPFTMPQVVPPPTPLKANVDAASINTSVPNFNDAYNTFLAQQSMNMDFLNKMAALYRQQASQPLKKPVCSSLPNDGQGE